MSETQAVRDIMHHVSGFHLVLNRDAFRNLLKESFHCGCFGSGNSDLYWTLLDEDRFVRTPRVVLINEATKHLEEEGWQEYSRWLATCLGASNTATNAQTDVEDDSALLDISLAGAEVKLIIWDDKTMVFKVELEGRWSADEADKINGFWGNGFLADEIPCVERNPFITAGTLREDVDAEAAGEDLLWRWMNPPPPPPDPQPEEEEIDELMNIYDDVSISLAGTWAQRQKKQVGKIFCDLLDNPVLLPGVIRPILEPDLHNPVCQRVNRELFFRELFSTKKEVAEGQQPVPETVAPIGLNASELRHDAEDVKSTTDHRSLEVKHSSLFKRLFRCCGPCTSPTNIDD